MIWTHCARLSAAAALLAGCARASVPPWPIATSDGRFIATATRLDVSFTALVDSVAKADVIFFGEMHDNPATHRAEASLLHELGKRRKDIVVSLEMFERDAQPQLNAYLAGLIPESTFLARSRPWPRYSTDYRPIVELAKKRKWPVIASNVPRMIATAVSRNSLNVLDTLGARRGLAARELWCPEDAYYSRFVQSMGGHSTGPSAGAVPDSVARIVTTKRFYQAQCVKDETMAESIVAARANAKPGALVIHFNGAFHSDFGLGTAERVAHRLPNISTVVISAVPVDSIAAADLRLIGARGNYIILVPKPPRK